MTTPELPPAPEAPAVGAQVQRSVRPLVERLQEEADLCRNEGATDIAELLDEAAAEVVALEQSSRTYFAERNSARDAVRRRQQQDAWTAAQMRAYAAEQVAAERERWMAAVSWALGTNGDFRAQGTMEGRYWWRGELAERAGLRWDGAQWVDAGPNAEVTCPPRAGHRSDDERDKG